MKFIISTEITFSKKKKKKERIIDGLFRDVVLRPPISSRQKYRGEATCSKVYTNGRLCPAMCDRVKKKRMNETLEEQVKGGISGEEEEEEDSFAAGGPSERIHGS